MARPVSFNIKEKGLEKDISITSMPGGHEGEGFFATKLSDVVGLARKNSIWPLPFPTRSWILITPSMIASGLGGQPAIYTSTGIT